MTKKKNACLKREFPAYKSNEIDGPIIRRIDGTLIMVKRIRH